MTVPEPLFGAKDSDEVVQDGLDLICNHQGFGFVSGKDSKSSLKK